MDEVEQALDLLRGTESSLRTMVKAAATDGNYDAVCQLATWARGLADLVNGTAVESAITAEVRTGGDRQAHVESLQARRAKAPAGSVPSSRRRRRPKAKRKVARKKGYPKFYRQREQLVKIGWSKRSSGEYVHRAPRKVVFLLATAIVKASYNAELISTDGLLPITDPEDNSDVPGYQAYLCLAWLREEGLLTPKGRQGYVVQNAQSLQDGVEKRWNSLPKKSM